MSYVNVKKDLRLYASIKNKSSLENIEKHIQNGCNVNSIFVNYGCTPIGLATKLGLTKTVKLLIKYGAIINDYLVEIACTNGHYKIVKILLNADPDLINSIQIEWAIPKNTYWNNYGGQSYTDSSFLNISLKIVNYLLQKGVRVYEENIKDCYEYSDDTPNDYLYYQIIDLLRERKKKQM